MSVEQRQENAGEGEDVPQDPAERADHHARHSHALERAVRAGLVAYGLVHLLITYVALRLAFGHHSTRATGEGALEQLAGDTPGKVTLAAMAFGFAVLVIWQVIAGLVGYRDRTGLSRHLQRIGAGARVVTYGYFAYESARVALDGRSAGHSTRSTMATVLSLPVGTVLVLGAGVILGCTGVGLAIFGWQAGFLGQLDKQARHQQRRTPIVVLGCIGYVVKGLTFAGIGGLIAWAGVTHKPGATGGLDRSLQELLGHSLGVPAVVVAGLGIGCFGVFLLVRARHFDSASITS